MANWHVTDSTFQIVGGTAYAGQTTDLTISPVDSNGVHSGAYIQASNFKIGGGSTSGGNIWTGGNKTSGIASVTFSNIPADNSLVGDINNKVKALITFESSGNFPTSVADFVIDIDEISTAAPGLAALEALSFKVQYPFFAAGQSTPAIENITDPDITESASGGDASNDYLVTLSGNISVNETINISTTTFTAAADYYYEETPSVVFYNIPNEFANWYSSEVIPTYVGGIITSFVVKIYYTIPPGYSEVPLAADNHLAHINMQIKQVEADPTTGIDDVILPGGTHTETDSSITGTIPYYGGVYNIIVKGATDKKYTINLEKRASLTSSATANGDWATDLGIDVTEIGGEFDFATKSYTIFSSGLSDGNNKRVSVKRKNNAGTIGSSGIGAHSAVFKEQLIKRRYDVIIEPDPKDPTMNINSKVPVRPGEAVIIQYGVKRVELKPLSYDNTSDVTVSDAITYTRPERYEGDPYGNTYCREVLVTGGTGGIASSTLTLQEENVNLRQDMILGGIDVGDNVLVTRVNSNKITLNKDVTISDDTPLRFYDNNSTVYPFSFTVAPAAGKVLSIAKDSEPVKRAPITIPTYLGGTSPVTRTLSIHTAPISSTTVDFTTSQGPNTGVDLVHVNPSLLNLHGTRGIVPGMLVGDSIGQLLDSSGNNVIVQSVTDHDTIVLSAVPINHDPVTSGDTGLIFTGGNGDMSLISINTNKVGNNMVISGAVKILNLDLTPPTASGLADITGRADLYLDSLIKVHN